jgi:hypothetical protein
MNIYNNSIQKQKTIVGTIVKDTIVKPRIINSKGASLHTAVLQLFYDRMNNGEGEEIYRKLTYANT